MPDGATKPVEETIAKVNDEVAVGSDLQFQRRWWRFERLVWILFGVIVILDLLGAFGRGYLAKRHLRTSDTSLDLTYERIERFQTPSIFTIRFGPAAIHGGQAQLWVSDSLVRSLGNQRVIPQPDASVVGQGGILYTFRATSPPASVAFAVEPASVGIVPLTMRVPGLQEIRTRILVVP
jgi:hypothetical protein